MADQLMMLVVGLAVFLPCTMAVVRWPQVGLGAIGIVIASSWQFPTWPAITRVLGLSVSLPDVLCVILLVAALITPRTDNNSRKLPKGITICVQLFVGILALSALRGVMAEGLSRSLNEIRPWLYIILISFWVLRIFSSHPDAKKLLYNWLFGTAALVLLVGAINVTRYGLGGASTAVRSSTGEILEAGRPIASGQAVLLAACAVLALFVWQEHRKSYHLFLGITCALAVVIVQHRSVWIAFACALIVAVLTLKSVNRFAIGFAGIAAVLGLYMATNAGMLGKVPELLASSATDSATYDGRVYDWIVLIGRSWESGPQAFLFGLPSGSGWWRYREDGLRIGYIPHNWYVATYLRVGIVGLIGMLGTAVLSIKFLIANCRQTPYLSLVVLIVVYGWAYNLQWYLAPLLACAVFGVFYESSQDLKMQRTQRSSEVRDLGSSPIEKYVGGRS